MIDSPTMIQAEIEKGIRLDKCRKCGCMRETLDTLTALVAPLASEETRPLRESLPAWRSQLEPQAYACLGCVHCYPAVAQNALTAVFPEMDQAPALVCDFRTGTGWPPVVGEFHLGDPAGHVAVSTLGSPALARQIAEARPAGLAIAGKTETENIGLDKIVKNVIANPGLQYLIVAGRETEGHQSGRTLLALAQNGTGAGGRVIGAPGKRPILRNVTAEEVAAFRKQIEVIDLIGCEDPVEIGARVESLSPKTPVPCG